MSQPAEQRAGKPAMLKDKDFQWEDPLDLEGELSEEERMVRDTARGFAQDYLMPRVIAAYRDETYDAQHAARDGQARPARADHSGRVRRRRPGLCRLRPDRARIGARRFGLPLGDVGAVVAGDVSDLRLWQRSAAAQISAQARQRRAGRLLRPDRARSRLRSGLHGDARGESRRRLQAQRRQDLDLQRAGRRCGGGVGQAR